MNKLLLLIITLFLAGLDVFASPGDTTWVTVYENRHIDHYGNYDTIAALPAAGTRYRKIRLHYILGRYSCPAGSQYCGSWDYTTSVYALPPTADTVELARIITPYATDWSTSRKHEYIVDVSDYASILNGNLPMQYQYEGYSWGFTVTLKIEFIEGVPPMDAVSVRNVYDGYFAYGSTADPIENHLTPKTTDYTAPVTTAFLKNTISGHGSDNNGCGEFCSKYYKQKIDGSVLEQRQLWRTTCGLNNISPQTGTWLFERANWCPGEIVYPIYHDLGNVTDPGTSFVVDMDFQPYTSPNQGSTGGYNVVSQLISYSAPNVSLDASIEDIISPTNDPNYARANSICDHPVIKIKNNGTTPLTSITIEYKLDGGQVATYNWTGNLAFLQEQVVDLGSNAALFAGNESNKFSVHLAAVNGQNVDDNTLNNDYHSTFTHVKVYPSRFVVSFNTNGAESGSNPGYNEAHWKITDASGAVVASRVNNPNNATLTDTLDLPMGCYTLQMDDDGCDGISWSFYSSYAVNPGSGTFRLYKDNSGGILKSYSGDFGCQFKDRFTVGYVLDVKEQDNGNGFRLFPNPANTELTLAIDNSQSGTVYYSISDVSGKTVLAGDFSGNQAKHTVDTRELKNGIYLVHCQFEDGSEIAKKVILNH